MSALEPGLHTNTSTEITAELSPPRLAPTIVLSTPNMIRLMEEACMDVVQPHLESDDQTSVGTHVNVSHESAAREGDTVVVSCVLAEISGRNLVFDVEASVGERIIGRGTHQRHIVDRSRFRS